MSPERLPFSRRHVDDYAEKMMEIGDRLITIFMP